MGEFQGGGTLNSLTSFTWRSGEVNGLAAFNVQGQLLITDAGDKTLTNTTLVTSAQGLWDNGNILLASSTFTNYGILEMRDGFEVRDTGAGPNPSLFQNLDGPSGHGTILRTGGGITKFKTTFSTSGDFFVNGQTIEFTNVVHQFGANSTTRLGGGTLELALGHPYALDSGTLQDGGTIQGDLNISSSGTLIVGSDANHLTLLVTGNYNPDITATLRVQARSDTSWGALLVGGVAALNGDLAIDLLGGYAPIAGTTKTVLQGVTVFGFFFLTPPGWNTTVTPTGVTVTKT
jgi:hypothetical protein